MLWRDRSRISCRDCAQNSRPQASNFSRGLGRGFCVSFWEKGRAERGFLVSDGWMAGWAAYKPAGFGLATRTEVFAGMHVWRTEPPSELEPVLAFGLLVYTGNTIYRFAIKP